MSLQSYQGSPVQVVDTGTDEHGVPVSAVVKVDIVATGDLESFSYAPAPVTPIVPVEPPATGLPGEPQPAEPVVVTGDYQGPDRRVAQRRSGVERRVA